MKKSYRIICRLVIIIAIMLQSVACSTMNLKQYPVPPINLYDKSKSIEGVSAIAQPLLDKKKSKEYFGVDLLQKNILAINLSVINNNPDVSFTLPSESINITQINSNDLINNPEKGGQEAGKAIGVVGALLISPLFMAIAAQLLSDASIIKENFEAKMLRTKTIDPGQSVSGFSYFNWADLKDIDKVNICFKLIDPLADRYFPFCLNVDLRR